MADSENTSFHALALTGGGYRGLYTAATLQVLEEHLGKPIGRYFDLITGTSIGGIVALAVAFEIPMKSVVEVFTLHGEAIFPNEVSMPRSSKTGQIWDLLKHLRKPKYSTAPLRNAINSLIPETATLADAIHPVVIPAINVTTGKPQVFKTRHLTQYMRDWRYRAVDVALATSAAPTFFELAEIDGNYYADGGLIANAPDLLAMHEAEHFLGLDASCIRMLSVGTTTKNYSLSKTVGRNLGVLDWMTNQRLFSIMISGQQQMTEQALRHRLGQRYVRIDTEPSQEQASDLGLDRATKVAKETLIALGRKTASDMLPELASAYFLHQPQLKILRG
jgi:uncharacterized protein